MTKQWPKIPRGLLSDERDGLADPDRITIEERHRYPIERLQEEYRRRTQQGPFIAALQRATDKALRRKKGKG